MLTGSGGGYSEALRLAWRWLRDSGTVQDTEWDHYAARAALAAAGGGDRAALLRYAYAYALAVEELHVRSRGYGAPSWGERHTAHLARLTRAAGYEPTAWEARHLAEADACAQARGTLACPGCGCTREGDGSGSAADCGIRYERDQDRPVYECSWGCGQHRAHRDQAADASTSTGPEDGDEDDDQGTEAGPVEDEAD